MTRDGLEAFLEGNNLWDSVDVKSLVVEWVKQGSKEEFEALFEALLPQLTREALLEYRYMQR